MHNKYRLLTQLRSQHAVHPVSHPTPSVIQDASTHSTHDIQFTLTLNPAPHNDTPSHIPLHIIYIILTYTRHNKHSYTSNLLGFVLVIWSQGSSDVTSSASSICLHRFCLTGQPFPYLFQISSNFYALYIVVPVMFIYSSCYFFFLSPSFSVISIYGSSPDR